MLALGLYLGSKDAMPVVPAGNVIYIDPGNSNSGRDGSLSNPFAAFSEIAGGITDNYIYRIKCGTEIVSSTVIDLSNRQNVGIMPYGAGSAPKFRFTGTGTCAIRFAQSSNCSIAGLEGYTNLSNSLITFVQMGTGTLFDGGSGNVIKSCYFHHVKQGTSDGGMGIRGGGTNLQILKTVIDSVGADGMYIRDAPGVIIENCTITKVNQNYAGTSVGFNSLGNGASGDGIQFDGNYDGFYLGHTTIDRSDAATGNKFPLILNSGNSGATAYTGIVEYCSFKTNANVAYAIDHVRGTGVKFRYNTFWGSTLGIRLEGAGCVDTLIHHNLFINCSNGVKVGYSYSVAPIGASTGTKVYNNVFYNISTYCTTVDKASIDLQNNIFYKVNGSPVVLWDYGAGSANIKNNCYAGGITVGTLGSGTGAVVVDDPLFLNTTDYNFRLNVASLCRNAGIDVGLTKDFGGATIPQGAMPDIGVFES